MTLRTLFCSLVLGATFPLVPADAAQTYDEHVRALRKQLPDEFNLDEEEAFVVLSDQPPRARESSLQTIRWATEHLKKDFFEKDPEEVIDIWLFENSRSYRRNAWRLFHDEPTTPYGYYSPKHHALVMNISTGEGTLVHELVHPFIRANFPNCPTWFNEGLASLFEQCAERNGHIVGEINWRLPKLQQAIREGKILPFEKLMALTPAEFYGEENNPNYSQYYGQSRYLCYYLQEKNLLKKYYHSFTANAQDDPTGYKSLQLALGAVDMVEFQKKWERFILQLR
ncbi:MAG: hypothetical protein QM790_13845 [Nibricoccus sp.]